jgi:hypothetical protein
VASLKERPPQMNSPEMQILLACARTRMPDHMAERVRALVREPIDWDTLLAGAENHHVAPLLWGQLEAVCAKSVPDEFREKLRARVEAIAHRNLLLASEMFRLATLFREAGVTVIPYKGPVLAARAYGSFALRQFVDLDFALRQRDLPRATELLRDQGYEPRFQAIAKNPAKRTAHGEYKFLRPESRLVVELHSEETLRYYPRPLDFDALFGRLRHVPLPGGEIETFSPEDTAILLAVHGAKHFWERLLWIADISELTQANGGVAWAKIILTADEMDVARMLRLALAVASHMLDAPLPKEVLAETRADAVATRLSGAIAARLSLTGTIEMPVFSRLRFRVAMRESAWQGIRYAYRLATLPTETDREALPLPEEFSEMHRWLRPFLLMKRYGVKK